MRLPILVLHQSFQYRKNPRKGLAGPTSISAIFQRSSPFYSVNSLEICMVQFSLTTAFSLVRTGGVPSILGSQLPRHTPHQCTAPPRKHEHRRSVFVYVIPHDHQPSGCSNKSCHAGSSAFFPLSLLTPRRRGITQYARHRVRLRDRETPHKCPWTCLAALHYHLMVTHRAVYKPLKFVCSHLNLDCSTPRYLQKHH
jgi:hypothetical protein